MQYWASSNYLYFCPLAWSVIRLLQCCWSPTQLNPTRHSQTYFLKKHFTCTICFAAISSVIKPSLFLSPYLITFPDGLLAKTTCNLYRAAISSVLCFFSSLLAGGFCWGAEREGFPNSGISILGKWRKNNCKSQNLKTLQKKDRFPNSDISILGKCQRIGKESESQNIAAIDGFPAVLGKRRKACRKSSNVLSFKTTQKETDFHRRSWKKKKIPSLTSSQARRCDSCYLQNLKTLITNQLTGEGERYFNRIAQ